MRNLNKVLALVLAFAVMFSMGAMAAPFTDVADDASYSEAVTLLSYLNIISGYPEGDFRPDGTITRAEAAKVIVAAMGATDAAMGSKNATKFSDVPSDHWAAPYINYAAGYGIIAGMGDGTFKPESPVTYEQMVKLIVSALGYEPMAKARGGWSAGYLFVASSVIKITKGATGEGGEPAKRWVVAKLLFNSLETPMMVQTVWDPSNPVYEVPEEGDANYKTLLYDYLEVTNVEGVVTETYLTEDFTSKDDKYVVIETTEINGEADVETVEIEVGDTNAATLIGQTVTAYIANYDDNDEILVGISPKAGENSTLAVDFGQFEKTTSTSGTTVTTSKITVEYFADPADKKPTEIKVLNKGADTATYFVNDREYTGNATAFANAYFKLFNEDYAKDGRVIFIDNNDDGYYDYVFVEEFKADYVVESITAKTYKIEDAITGNKITLDPTDEDAYVTFYKDGAEVEFSAIAEGDVLTLMYEASTLPNSKNVKVYISSEAVEGQIKSVNTDGDKFTIGSTAYKASSKWADKLALGDDGKFFINVNGRIVYSDAITNMKGDYAYILEAGMDSTFSGGSSIKVKMLNSEGTWVVAPISAKASFTKYTLDGTELKEVTNKITKIADIKGANLSTYTDGLLAYVNNDVVLNTAGNRVVKVELNSDGEITNFTVPRAGKEDEDAFTYNTINADKYDADATEFDASNREVDENTIIFFTKVTNPDETSEVKVVSMSALKDNREYTGYGYDATTDNAYKALAVVSSDSSVQRDERFIVVKSVGKTLDADDKKVISITGLQNGEDVTLTTTDDYTDADFALERDGSTDLDVASDLNKGDVVVVTLNPDGNIEALVRLVDITDVKAGVTFNDTFNSDSDERDVLGYILAKSTKGSYGMGLAAYINTENEFDRIATAGSSMTGNVYLVDTTERTIAFDVLEGVDTDYVNVAPETIADANDDDSSIAYYAYARTTDGDVVDIVIFGVAPVENMYNRIIFNTQGGSSIESVSLALGAKATAPTAPTKTGFTFDGWYKEAACTTAWNFATDTVDAPTTVYAKWTPVA